MNKWRSWIHIHIWKDQVWSKVLGNLIWYTIFIPLGVVIYSLYKKVSWLSAFNSFWYCKIPVYYIFLSLTVLSIVQIILYLRKRAKAKLAAADIQKIKIEHPDGVPKIPVTIESIKAITVGPHDMDALIEALKTQSFQLRNSFVRYNTFEIYLDWYPVLINGIDDMIYDDKTELVLKCCRVLEGYGLMIRKVWGAGTGTDKLFLSPTGIEFYTKLHQHYLNKR